MDKIEIYSPVIIPTLNRFEHFKRCLESLERCTGASNTDVYVGLDYPPSEKYFEGWKKIDTYLAEKEKRNGFRRLFVRRRDHNCGAGKPGSNSELLSKEIKGLYDKYIFTEDDNEFSPNFLEFMNAALCKYQNEPRIIRVSGYNTPELRNVTQKNVFCNIDSPAYGLGHWVSKKIPIVDNVKIQQGLRSSFCELWKMFWTYPALVYKAIRMIEKNASYGDIQISMHNLFFNTYTLCPTLSLVRTWGCDGSGLHGGVVKGLEKMEIMNDTHFILDDIDIETTKELRKGLRYRNMPKSHIGYSLHIIYYMMVTFKFFFNKK